MERLRKSDYKLVSFPIDLTTEYTPFWFRFVKVEIVSSNYLSCVISPSDSANLKKDPPPICSISNILNEKLVISLDSPAKMTSSASSVILGLAAKSR